jgi:hypothetical protein
MLGDTYDRVSYLTKRIVEDSWEDYTAFSLTVIALVTLIDEDAGEELYRLWKKDYDDYFTPDQFLDELRTFLRKHDLEHTPYDKFLPWVYRELRRDGALARGEISLDEMLDFLKDLPEWQAAAKVDLGRLTFDQAVQARDAWREADQAKRVVYAFPDGWRILKLTRRRELEDEGKCLKHCVGDGDYYKKVRAGEAVILSLRNPRNISEATLEWSPQTKHFIQIKGHANTKPDPTVRPYLVELIQRVFGGDVVGLLQAGVPGRELNLAGIDLADVDLSGLDLSGADLDYSDLRKADLRGTNLYGASHHFTDLNGAIFDRETILFNGMKWNPSKGSSPAGLGRYHARARY